MKFYITPLLAIIALAPALTNAVCYYSDSCVGKLERRIYADDGFVPRGVEVNIASRASLEDSETAGCCCTAIEYAECDPACVSIEQCC